MVTKVPGEGKAGTARFPHLFYLRLSASSADSPDVYILAIHVGVANEEVRS